MSRYRAVRLLENFFRRWWLFAIPVVLVMGFGVLKVKGMKNEYRAGGTLNVASSTLLASLSDVRNDQGFGFDTPAGAMSKQLNSLLQTDQFIDNIIDSAGVKDAVASGQLTIDQVRKSVSSWPSGANLLRIVSATGNPVFTQRLAQATIDEYTKLVLNSEVSDSQAAQQFYDDLAKQYQVQVTDARAAVDTYLAAHPAPLLGQTRPADQVSQIDALTSALTQAQARYDNAAGKGEDARLAVQQATSDVAQRLRVLDKPETPTAPEPKRKQMLMNLAVFLALAVLVGLGTVFVATILDHTLRTSSDVRDRLGLRVLAVVPDAGSKGFLRRAPAKSRKARRKVEEPATELAHGTSVAFASKLEGRA